MGAKERIRYKNDIINMFCGGTKMSEIAIKLNINRKDVKDVLVDNKLYSPRTREEAKKEADNAKREIIELYTSGLSARKIYSTLRNKGMIVGERRIISIIKQEFGEIKSAKDYNRQFYADDDAFQTYDKYSCYWAGLIAADGCVHKHSGCDIVNYVSLSLAEEDRSTVEGLIEYTNYTGNILFVDKKKYSDTFSNCCEVRINNISIVDNLKKNFNITERKSVTYCPPITIPNELIKYFILGYIDGDGSITYTTSNTGRKQFALNITGTREMCEFIKSYFGSTVKLMKRNKDTDSNNWTLCIQGNTQLHHILQELYEDEDIVNICMSRKFKRFLMLKEQQETKIKCPCKTD